MFPQGVSPGCGRRPMVIDGRGYYRALGPTYTPYSGSMLDPQHQLGTAILPDSQEENIQQVRRLLTVPAGGENFLSQD